MQDLKIKKYNYYWLILPAFCLALQMAGFLYTSASAQEEEPAPAIANSPSAPQVLGAFTQVRGTQDQTLPVNPEKIKEPDLSEISAESLLAYDLDSGFVYAQKNPEEKVSIASLTKLLTALLVYENGNFADTVKITGQDQLNVSPGLGLRAGDQLAVEDLFNSMLVGSTNDAALALSNYLKNLLGKNFVGLMNEKAKALGMSASNFSNPWGFDSVNNYSTASDLQKLVNATQKLAAFTNLGKKSFYDFKSTLGNSYSVKATNKLITNYPDLQAVKTGLTESSKQAMITKLTADSHKVIIIVLESRNRAGDTLLLRKQILDSYKF